MVNPGAVVLDSGTSVSRDDIGDRNGKGQVNLVKSIAMDTRNRHEPQCWLTQFRLVDGQVPRPRTDNSGARVDGINPLTTERSIASHSSS